MRNRPPHVFPQLYALASTGKVKVWQVRVKLIDGVPHIVRRHGYVDGTIQEAAKPVATGKNVGRANATTPWQQAVSEAEALHQKKLDANYRDQQPEPGELPPTNVLPMLAHSTDKSAHRLVWPCAAQPKLNGVRNMADRTGEELIHRSRTGKVWGTFAHLNDAVNKLAKEGWILDGEIYIHGVGFQSLVSWAKKLQPETAQLEYWVYDVAIPNVSFEERWDMLKMRWNEMRPLPHLVQVPTVICSSMEKLKLCHDRWVRQGYEGAIARNLAGHYRFDHRSADLQKMKTFHDAEFKIVGGKEGTGRHAGCCVFECETPEGKRFSCYPKGTLVYRRELAKQLPTLIGKMLTVRYQEKSVDLIPIFPVGIIVRDYE